VFQTGYEPAQKVETVENFVMRHTLEEAQVAKPQ